MSEPEQRPGRSPRGDHRTTEFVAPSFPSAPEEAWQDAAAEDEAGVSEPSAEGTGAVVMEPMPPPMPSQEIVAELEAWRPMDDSDEAGLAPGDRARIIAIANQKGGVGKSTTAVNLGACLAEKGQRVLVVDLDPQGNASTGLGIDHAARTASTYQVLTAGLDIREALIATEMAGLSAVASTIDLAGAEIELVTQFSRESRLARALDPIRGEFDFILLDCPPSLGLLTVNALTAAAELIVPIQCEYYALEGLGQLLKNVRLVQQNVNPQLRLTGIVLTMFDARTKLAEQVVSEVRSYFGGRVYDAVIPRSVRLAEAPGFGRPITMYDPGSKGALAYRRLAEELLPAGRADGRVGDTSGNGMQVGGAEEATTSVESTEVPASRPEEDHDRASVSGVDGSSRKERKKPKGPGRGGRRAGEAATRARTKRPAVVGPEESPSGRGPVPEEPVLPGPDPTESSGSATPEPLGPEESMPDPPDRASLTEDAGSRVVQADIAPDGEETGRARVGAAEAEEREDGDVSAVDEGAGTRAADRDDDETPRDREVEPEQPRKRRWRFGRNRNRGGQS